MSQAPPSNLTPPLPCGGGSVHYQWPARDAGGPPPVVAASPDCQGHVRHRDSTGTRHRHRPPEGMSHSEETRRAPHRHGDIPPDNDVVATPHGVATHRHGHVAVGEERWRRPPDIEVPGGRRGEGGEGVQCRAYFAGRCIGKNEGHRSRGGLREVRVDEEKGGWGGGRHGGKAEGKNVGFPFPQDGVGSPSDVLFIKIYLSAHR
mmetsp:Transcript_41271/g.80762  ORF Transcript_41271/g.80762 Transcript_41271/m.80762 type:complete len:204 (-) Transcript_41271:204-815(-)